MLEGCEIGERNEAEASKKVSLAIAYLPDLLKGVFKAF